MPSMYLTLAIATTKNILFVHPPTLFYFCQLIFLSISTLLAFLPIYYVFFGLNVCPLANSICLSVCLYVVFCISIDAVLGFSDFSSCRYACWLTISVWYSFLLGCFVCLPVCLPVYLPLGKSIRLSVSLPICFLSACLNCPSSFLHFCLSNLYSVLLTCLPIYLSPCLLACLPICLSACLSVFPSVCLSICLSPLYLPLSIVVSPD
jgi:hypothetical protein